MPRPALIFSSGIRKIPSLQAFLPEYRFTADKHRAQAVIGWGLRPSTTRARAYAQQNALPYIALEDGFVRSLGLGVQGWPPLSLVVDDSGIYYDTTRPSRLETLVLASDGLDHAVLQQAEEAMRLLVDRRLSKYNHAPDLPAPVPAAGKPVVLLIDQTVGDAAIRYGSADADTFHALFQTALRDNPQAEIWVKTHPDVLCGKKQGYLADLARQHNVRLLAQDCNPITLLQAADKVYCVTSQMGFEALLCGKEVHTFGLPWYAGWGISTDHHPDAAALAACGRRAPRTLVQLFAAAYLQYSRYLNPNTGEAGTLFDVIGYLDRMRRLNGQLSGDIYCVGVSLWKRAVMRPFFRLPACRLHFVPSVEALARRPLPPGTRLLAWGNGKQAVLDFAAERGLPVLRMEDGFIRSVGLGSNLVPPLSLVIDDLGIYFNPQTPSRLEELLQNHPFDRHDRAAAETVRQALLDAQISKYNVGSSLFTPPPPGKRVLLVPGQVEDDASIRSGAPGICRNLDLLKTVRERHPDAYIIYKPHPDVVSGNRTGSIPAEECARYADQTAEHTDILLCLHHADEVHTMTSLTGFEALLRGKTVHCYGIPFYAGWGLTRDEWPQPRRSRRLELWQLVAGTLLAYPCYIHPDTRRHTDALTAITILKKNKDLQKNNTSLRRSWPAKQLGKLQTLYRSLR